MIVVASRSRSGLAANTGLGPGGTGTSFQSAHQSNAVSDVASKTSKALAAEEFKVPCLASTGSKDYAPWLLRIRVMRQSQVIVIPALQHDINL